MKKALIALSVAAGMIAAAQAENTTTLYGTLKYQTQVTKASGEKATSAVKDNRWNLDTASIKLGVKGTEDLANGLQVFYKMEFGGDASKGLNSTKKAYLGFTGGFGTLTLGKQDSLYKVVTNYNDIFESVYFGETMHYGAATGGGDLAKAISYVSPNFNGFQFGVAGVLDADDNAVNYKGIRLSDNKSFTAYQVGAWYSQNGFYAGLAYSVADTGALASIDRAGSIEVIGAAVGYSNDQFKVGFSAEHKEGWDHDYAGLWNLNPKDAIDAYSALADGNKYSLAGEYYYGPHTFRAGFGLADYNHDSDNIYSYALGYQYNFSKRTYTYVEAEYIDWNDSEIKNGYTVNLGLRHNF